MFTSAASAHAPAIRLRATHGNGAAASMDYVPANARLEQRVRSAVMPWPTRSKRPSFYIRERTHHVLDAMGRVRLQANPGRFRGVAARAGMDSKEICRVGAKRTTAALREGRSQPTCASRSQFRNRATRLAWSIPLRSSAHTRSFAAVRPRPSKAVDGIRTPYVGLDWAIRFPIGLPMDCGFPSTTSGERNG